MSWYPHGCCRFCAGCGAAAGAVYYSAPVQWQVDVTGLALTVPQPPPPAIGCNDCPSLNASYVLDPVEHDTSLWEYVLEAPLCAVVKLRLQLNNYSFPGYLISFNMFDAAGAVVMHTERWFADRIDCRNASGISLDRLYTPGTNSPYYNICQGQGGNVKITALRACQEDPA